MMNDIQKRYFGTALAGVFLAIALLSFKWWIAALIHAWRASLFLGYWPYYGHPDPKDLPEHFHPTTEFLEHLIPWGFFGLILVGLLYLIHRFHRLEQKLLLSTLAIPAGWFAGFVLLRFDPGGVVEWIID